MLANFFTHFIFNLDKNGKNGYGWNLYLVDSIQNASLSALGVMDTLNLCITEKKYLKKINNKNFCVKYKVDEAGILVRFIDYGNKDRIILNPN